MLRNSLLALVILLFGYMFYNVYSTYDTRTELSGISQHYAEKGAKEVGAANLVTAIVVTYRGLDTLGEVSILFLTAAIISFALTFKKEDELEERELRVTSEILSSATQVLTPIIMMVGIYIFINGHLTPGGGFQGGAVIASAVLLMLLTNPKLKISHSIIAFVESISGLAFIGIGIIGIVAAGGFLDNRIMSLGTFGTLLSAGAIPLIYIFIGLKVGAELSNIIGTMSHDQNEK